MYSSHKHQYKLSVRKMFTHASVNESLLRQWKCVRFYFEDRPVKLFKGFYFEPDLINESKNMASSSQLLEKESEKDGEGRALASGIRRVWAAWIAMTRDKQFKLQKIFHLKETFAEENCCSVSVWGVTSPQPRYCKLFGIAFFNNMHSVEKSSELRKNHRQYKRWT